MPAPLHIAVVVGSLRRDSFNRRLADAIEKLAPAHVRFSRLRPAAVQPGPRP